MSNVSHFCSLQPDVLVKIINDCVGDKHIISMSVIHSDTDNLYHAFVCTCDNKAESTDEKKGIDDSMISWVNRGKGSLSKQVID